MLVCKLAEVQLPEPFVQQCRVVGQAGVREDQIGSFCQGAEVLEKTSRLHQHLDTHLRGIGLHPTNANMSQVWTCDDANLSETFLLNDFAIQCAWRLVPQPMVCIRLQGQWFVRGDLILLQTPKVLAPEVDRQLLLSIVSNGVQTCPELGRESLMQILHRQGAAVLGRGSLASFTLKVVDLAPGQHRHRAPMGPLKA